MIAIIFVNPSPENLAALSTAQIVETITANHVFRVNNDSFTRFSEMFLRELPNVQLKVVEE